MLTLETLRGLLAETLGRPMPPLTPETRFEALPGWDSVIHLSVLLEAERAAGRALTARQMVEARTVGDLLGALGGEP